MSGVEHFMVVVTALPVEDTELRDAAMGTAQQHALRSAEASIVGRLTERRRPAPRQ